VLIQALRDSSRSDLPRSYRSNASATPASLGAENLLSGLYLYVPLSSKQEVRHVVGSLRRLAFETQKSTPGITEGVRLNWHLLVQLPPKVLEYRFNSEISGLRVL
jgi:hypothetical protein